MPRTRVVIQSRLNSSRLPGKALMSIGGMPMIELAARRAARGGHEVIVATSDEPYDDLIARHLEAVDIPVLRGPLDDVLGRFVLATADLADDDRVVRLTGDNPVMDAEGVDELLAAMDASGNAYGRVDMDRAPEGLGAEAFWVGDLRRAAEQAVEPYDREHVTPWLRRTLGELAFVPARNPGDIHRFRCTVDSLHDYYRVSHLFFGVPDPVAVRWTDLIDALAVAVDIQGTSVPMRDPAAFPLGQSAFVLDAATLPSDPVECRALLTDAVDRGVTHLQVDDDHAAYVRAQLEPQLVRRLQPILLPSIEDGVAAGVERTFALLGRRAGAAVLTDNSVDSVAAQQLSSYTKDGTIARFGVRAATLAAGKAALESGASFVELPLPLGSAPDFLDVARPGVKVVATNVVPADSAKVQELVIDLARADAADLGVAYALGHPAVTSVIAPTPSRHELASMLDAVAAKPLSQAEIDRVDAVLGAEA